MKPSLLDRTIGYFSPTAGVRRAQARLVMQTLGYEGAKQGRRNDGWITGSSDADGESQPVIHFLRDRARDLVRNNPYAASALDVRSTEVIGSGIVAEIGHKALGEMWSTFVDTCDWEGDHDFYGLQTLIERCRSEAGECLVRFMYVERSREQLKQGVVPLQLRVLEPDYIDQSRDGKAENGNVIRYGIEYDARGKVAAYYLFDRHPGESSVSSFRALGFNSSRVPADQILHIFRKLRPGQSRGVTDFAPVMARLRNLDDYDDAELMRKKIEACLAAFVTAPAGQTATPFGTPSTDDIGRIETMYPGMVGYLGIGETVTMSDPKTSGGYVDFKRFSGRDIAMGYGIPYELLTGDLSQVNYSSYRAGLVRFRRRIDQDQWQLYIPRLCDPVLRRFADEARALKRSPAMGMNKPVAWTPPRFELIDPLKETQAEVAAVLAGFDTWEEVVRRRGWTASEQLDVIDRWQKDLNARGVVLNSNAASVMSAASQQPAATPATDPANDDDADEVDGEEKAA